MAEQDNTFHLPTVGSIDVRRVLGDEIDDPDSTRRFANLARTNPVLAREIILRANQESRMSDVDPASRTTQSLINLASFVVAAIEQAGERAASQPSVGDDAAADQQP